MQSIIEHLNTNLKVLYRQAIDADAQLDLLQKQGHGKFSSLFKHANLFTVREKRFLPYVLEIAADVSELSEQQEIDQEKLGKTVKKIESVHKLLQVLKSN